MTRRTINDDEKPATPSGQPCRDPACGRITSALVLANHGGLCIQCCDALARKRDPRPAFGEPAHRDTFAQREMRRALTGRLGVTWELPPTDLERSAKP